MNILMILSLMMGSFRVGFLKEAAALALRKVPQCNSSWMNDFICQYHNVNINVAVQTDNGLFVPVIRDADKKGLSAISEENELKNNSLQLATKEQQKADEDVLALRKKQEQEKKDAFNRIIHLEKQLDAKQKLELEIQQLKGKLQVMKHMGDEEDVSVKKKMEEMDEELKEKTEEMEDLEAMNQTLLIKERKSNDELQEARKELISDLRDMFTGRSLVGIKRMGELDDKSFQNACKERFSKDEAAIKAAELCSKWEEELRKPDWHPFKIINVEGKHQASSRRGDAARRIKIQIMPLRK